jgi:uncharacterized protein
MTPTELLVPTYRQMLQALAGWLRKAEAQLGNADALMAARLAPDMFPLSTQIRFACRQAHEGARRLRHEPFPAEIEDLQDEGRRGGEVPGTLADALVRIDEALAYLDTIPAKGLDGGESAPLAIELPMGLAFDTNGEGYVRDWALPQFYFHIMTAYAILRQNGITLGKADFVQHMFAFLRPGTGPAGKPA